MNYLKNNFKKYVFINCLILIYLIIPIHTDANESEIKPQTNTLNKTATELVEIIDSYRGLSEAGFSFDITNVSYKADRDSRTNQLSVDVKTNNSLVEFKSPARQKGRILLKKEDDMWLYIPGTRRVIRISPAQRLLGETSNADVTGSNFSRDYNAQIITTKTDKKAEQIQLVLTAKNKKMSYQKVLFWLTDTPPFKPIKSEYFARSGKLLKTAQYKAFKEFNGELKIHKMLLSDPLISGSFTWMLFDNYRLSTLPDALFNKEAIVNL
ncbi:outer membrane lipoprotein-sorting protein [Pseudoalteromonas denitrificans]|uniref:Uncharacterized protein TP-0789 domain-containing protein n=1 Tax=Pseudoalteromonas denitrificans DSM 6059 TaxID=1123010 RepID=A0A1I1I7A3_9GAMM|nr:outer membrane lipoprotein-sorting protein [Pseudoalteromonas denitrificans]SFC32309.1 hypothetical protein SAMN02745724_01422 [Pseudoalteromonas denitrificans DSM 6059]